MPESRRILSIDVPRLPGISVLLLRNKSTALMIMTKVVRIAVATIILIVV